MAPGLLLWAGFLPYYPQTTPLMRKGQVPFEHRLPPELGRTPPPPQQRVPALGNGFRKCFRCIFTKIHLVALVLCCLLRMCYPVLCESHLFQARKFQSTHRPAGIRVPGLVSQSTRLLEMVSRGSFSEWPIAGGSHPKIVTGVFPKKARATSTFRANVSHPKLHNQQIVLRFEVLVYFVVVRFLVYGLPVFEKEEEVCVSYFLLVPHVFF